MSSKYPGGELGKKAIQRCEQMASLLSDLSDKIEFIASGLGGEEPRVEGAKLICRDIVNEIEERFFQEDPPDIPGMVRELAEIADGKAPLLPETHYEQKLFEALIEMRGHWNGLGARNFMCQAALGAYEVYKAKYLDTVPGGRAIADVVAKVEETMPTAKEVSHGQD